MKRKHWLRYLPAAAGAVLVVLVAAGVYLARDLFQKPVQAKKQVQQISVVQPPPPPPPPPERKPPEPEVKEERIEEPEPEPEPEPPAEAPPPGEQLGVDADGGAGGDAFGLVGRKGGQGLIGGGGGGNAIIWYGQHVQREISDELQRSLKDKARNSKYSAVVHLWIGPDGRVTRVELANSSGTAEIDEALKAALGGIHDRFKPPPEHMPQPLKIRIRS